MLYITTYVTSQWHPCYTVGCIFPQIVLDSNQHFGDNKFKYKLRIHGTCCKMFIY